MEPEAEKYLLEAHASTLAMTSHQQRKRAAMGIFDRSSSEASSGGGSTDKKNTGWVVPAYC